MKILTIVHNLGLGGTERAAQNFTIGYHNRGYTTAVLTTHAGGIREAELHKHAIPQFIGNHNDKIRKIAVERAIKWEPDVIHIHRPGFADVITMEILKRFVQNKKKKIKIFETNVFSLPDYSKERPFINIHLHLSKWCFWKWKQWTRTVKPKLLGTVIPYPVDTSFFYPENEQKRYTYRKRIGIPEDAFVFGRVGQAIESKWSITAFRSFLQIARKSEKAFLLVVGMPKKYQKYVDSFDASIRARVVHIPFVSDDDQLREIYNTMDVFVHSSKKGESFGYVLAEAMLCGVPVITLSTPSRDNSQIEVVGQMEGGIVVGNETSFREAMDEMMHNPEMLRTISTGGRHRIIDRYELNLVISRMLQIIRHVYESNNDDNLAKIFRESHSAHLIEDKKYNYKVLKTVRGRAPFKEILLMRLIHNPWVYRIWNLLRGTLTYNYKN